MPWREASSSFGRFGRRASCLLKAVFGIIFAAQLQGCHEPRVAETNIHVGDELKIVTMGNGRLLGLLIDSENSSNGNDLYYVLFPHSREKLHMFEIEFYCDLMSYKLTTQYEASTDGYAQFIGDLNHITIDYGPMITVVQLACSPAGELESYATASFSEFLEIANQQPTSGPPSIVRAQ